MVASSTVDFSNLPANSNSTCYQMHVHYSKLFFLWVDGCEGEYRNLFFWRKRFSCQNSSSNREVKTCFSFRFKIAKYPMFYKCKKQCHAYFFLISSAVFCISNWIDWACGLYRNIDSVSIHQKSFLLAASPIIRPIIEALMAPCAKHLANHRGGNRN